MWEPWCHQLNSKYPKAISLLDMYIPPCIDQILSYWSSSSRMFHSTNSHLSLYLSRGAYSLDSRRHRTCKYIYSRGILHINQHDWKPQFITRFMFAYSNDKKGILMLLNSFVFKELLFCTMTHYLNICIYNH